MVERHFSSIPNNNLPGNDFSSFSYQNAFKPQFYEKVLFVKPLSNILKIDLTWCMEPQIEVNSYIIQIIIVHYNPNRFLFRFMNEKKYQNDLQVFKSVLKQLLAGISILDGEEY